MKKHISFILTAALLMCACLDIHASNSCKEDWKKKMMSEKIAFLTIELDITPEEAQAFWPVYNQVENERDEAMHAVFKAYMELEQALENGKNGKEVENLLKAYIDAQKKQNAINADAAEKYAKVLPADKVAKLYVGEEKFRRQHIRRLHEKHGEKK